MNKEIEKHFDALESNITYMSNPPQYPKEYVRKYIEELERFKEYFDDLCGQGLEIANWHLNGDLKPFDELYEGAIEEMDSCNDNRFSVVNKPVHIDDFSEKTGELLVEAGFAKDNDIAEMFREFIAERGMDPHDITNETNSKDERAKKGNRFAIR